MGTRQIGQWPAGARRRIQRIEQLQAGALHARPGDHRGIVGTQRRRRYTESKPALLRKPQKGRADRMVGRNTASNDQNRIGYFPLLTKLFHRHANPVHQTVDHRRLKGGRKVRARCRSEIRIAYDLTHGRLEVGRGLLTELPPLDGNAGEARTALRNPNLSWPRARKRESCRIGALRLIHAAGA